MFNQSEGVLKKVQHEGVSQILFPGGASCQFCRKCSDFKDQNFLTGINELLRIVRIAPRGRCQLVKQKDSVNRPRFYIIMARLGFIFRKQVIALCQPGGHVKLSFKMASERQLSQSTFFWRKRKLRNLVREFGFGHLTIMMIM